VIAARIVCAALVAAAACSDKANEPIVELRLPRAQPVQGEQILVVDELTIDSTFTMDGREHAWTYERRSEMLGRTIAVDGFAVRVAEVTYKRIDQSREIDGKGEQLPDSKQGKTFSVRREGGEVYAIPMNGDASEQELEDVRDDNDSVGVPDEIDAVVAEKTWKTGQPIAFTDEEIARVNASRFRSDPSRKILTAMKLTLRSIRDKVAIFSVEMGMRYESTQDSYNVDLRGHVRIETTTGHVLELGGAGNLEGTMTGVPVKGRMTWKTMSRWVGSR